MALRAIGPQSQPEKEGSRRGTPIGNAAFSPAIIHHPPFRPPGPPLGADHQEIPGFPRTGTAPVRPSH
ncbi:hypothetical protein SBV1_590058 [Verrucomicrobia bacterium]|nr:hypothetical protein SBV1_590058 [Verrucomicrobiota bacterium]